jgi:hypothetical protein
MSENGPQGNTIIMQQLADLGFSREVRGSLTSEEIEKIVSQNMTFESFQKEKQKILEDEARMKKASKVPQEVKDNYKVAYEKFVALEEGFKEFALDSEVERFNAILKICGSGILEEIENYLKDHEIELSDEEVEFLEKTIEYRKAVEVGE